MQNPTVYGTVLYANILFSEVGPGVSEMAE